MAYNRTPISDKQPNARKKLLNILLMRSYSVDAARKLLLRYGYEADAVEDALTWASSLGYLNDENLAERCASSLVESKGITGQRLRQELYRKGLSAETVDQALDRYSSKEDETARCLALVRKFLSRGTSGQEMGDSETKKLVRRLRRLGYGWAAISGALRQFGMNGDADFPPSEEIDG